MPHEFLSTDAPVSAVDSAAQGTVAVKDHSEGIIQSSGEEYVRPRLRMVAGGLPIVEKDEYPAIVRATDLESEDWPEGWSNAGMASEVRMENGNGSSKAPYIRAVDADAVRPKANGNKAKTYQGPRQSVKNEFRQAGLKKQNKKQIALEMPPTPRGCEWRRSDDGMNLWRCWTEWDDDKATRIKKSRYAGHLSDDAWRIMKEYDHEAFISTVGERLRRHSGR